MVCKGEEMSYSELALRSENLALYLQSLGVKPDDRVGLCLDRSLDMIMSIFGVLSSGGAYVPLDPDYPDERLSYMLEDSGVKILLVDSSVKEKMVPLVDKRVHVICIDQDFSMIQEKVLGLKSEGMSLRKEVRGNNLCYIIYTSGSTGKPKGVMVEHRSVVNFVFSIINILGFSKEDRFLSLANYCFDISIYHIMTPLLTRGTLLLSSNEERREVEKLKKAIKLYEPTIMDATPSLWQALLSSGWKNSEKMRLVCGWESLPSSLRDQFMDMGVPVWNLFGPTEATVASNFWRLNSKDSIRIGGPIGNTQNYILDSSNNLCPVGVPGELCIGGVGVARGYLNREELNQEKFIRSPFDSSQRIYKTGDLARWLDNGEVEFLGRMDTQIKIRGYRVEVEEIESHLNKHGDIISSAVVVQGTGLDKKLVAFYEMEEKDGDFHDEVDKPSVIASVDLKNHLGQFLPNYMVPSVFVCIDKIPVTPNGKLNRRFLESQKIEMGVRDNYVPPKNATEIGLVKIWSEVLDIDADMISIDHDFFDLGGHSLLATQVLSQIRSHFNVDVSFECFFSKSTVSALSEEIINSQRSKIPALKPISREEFTNLPVSYAQERVWFLHQFEKSSSIYNIPFGLRFKGSVDILSIQEALSKIISRHESLRTVFSFEDGQVFQKILEDVRIQIEEKDFSSLGEIKMKEFCEQEARRPFDLSKDLLVRAYVLKLSELESVLFLNMHHIITDGWSIGIFTKELSFFMNDSEQERMNLEDLPIQYVDYSVWQRKLLEEEGVLEDQLSYWEQKLSDMEAVLKLFTDKPRPIVQDHSGSREFFVLDMGLKEGLESLAREQGCTLHMLVLAIFKTLLYRYSNQSDISVGTAVANRQYKETHGLMGMFVNTLCLRDIVDGKETFLSFLRKVKRTCLESYENQDVPFEKVVERIQPERNTSIHPLFQAMFVLQNMDLGELPEGWSTTLLTLV